MNKQLHFPSFSISSRSMKIFDAASINAVVINFEFVDS